MNMEGYWIYQYRIEYWDDFYEPGVNSYAAGYVPARSIAEASRIVSEYYGDDNIDTLAIEATDNKSLLETIRFIKGDENAKII